MRGLFEIVFGTNVFDLEGEKGERFLNILAFHNIDLLSIENQPGDSFEQIRIRVRRKDVPKVKELALKYHLIVKKNEEEGIPQTCRLCRKRHSFTIGAVLCFIFLFVMSHCIWKIEFVGNSYHSKEALLSYLHSRKIQCGALSVLFHWDEEELLLRKQYEDIAWCSMSMDGCKLTVIVTEGEEKTESKPKRKNHNIIASHKAMITSIVTRTGTPMVKKGDIVKRGQILIAGEIPYLDDSGEVTGKKKCVADGDITGEYRMPIHLRMRRLVPYKKTVSKHHRVGCSFKGIRLISPCLYKEKKSDVIMTDYKAIAWSDACFWPIAIQKQEIKEIRIVQKKRSEKEIKHDFRKKLREIYKKLSKNRCKVIEKNLHIADNKKEVLLTGYLKVKISFSTKNK